MMNDRISIQAQTSTRDAAGQPVKTWAEVASVFAEPRFLSGLETIRAGAEMSVAKVSFRVRARGDVNETMRVIHKGRTYEVKAPPLPDARDSRFMFLACESVDA